MSNPYKEAAEAAHELELDKKNLSRIKYRIAEKAAEIGRTVHPGDMARLFGELERLAGLGREAADNVRQAQMRVQVAQQELRVLARK